MILAGEIGATRTRLAAFETEGNRLNRAVEKNYMSQEHAGLSEIIDAFVKTEGILVHRACVGVGRGDLRDRGRVLHNRDACAVSTAV